MAVADAIQRAERVLAHPSVRGSEIDPRWQAILDVADYIEESPQQVWSFIRRWGSHEEDDVRAAVATCLLEHLLEHHFDRFFPLVQEAVADRRFADTFSLCWKFGQAEQPANSSRFDQLRKDMADRRRG